MLADAPATASARRRLRVLFVAEAVTLAHVARPAALARTLDPAEFDCTIACHPRAHRFLDATRTPLRPLGSIDASAFLDRLSRGAPLYDEATLAEYVDADLALIADVRPDVVVGDFRLSLAVSARHAQVPYATITNAYWSPFVAQRMPPMPVLPMTRWLPVGIADALFRAAWPVASAVHCRPLNALRRRYGQATLGNDLRRVYTDADQVFYADMDGLFAMREPLPASHACIGPIVWSPPVGVPSWWNAFDQRLPTVYVTLGSSGATGALQQVLDALASAPVQVMASHAGRPPRRPVASNTRLADYLPGDAATMRSAVVVCNGGSLTCYQAIACGVPILGIAANMDQFLNMRAIVEAGAGILLRADRLSTEAIGAACQRLLDDPRYAERCRALGTRAAAAAAGSAFVPLLRALPKGYAGKT